MCFNRLRGIAMHFTGLTRTFSTENEQQYETIGAFWEEAERRYHCTTLRGLGYHWTADTIEYVIGLTDGVIEGADCTVILPDEGWTEVRGRTEELGRLYEKIYQDGPLSYEIESFDDGGNCRILYSRSREGYFKIVRACEEDLGEILKLQYLAYQSEAALFGTDDIPPLKQTIEEVKEEFRIGMILKMVTEDNRIIGSVRSHVKDGTAYLGKLMVHPDDRGRSLGGALLSEIERYSEEASLARSSEVAQSRDGLPRAKPEGREASRFELFTSTRSEANIQLYQKKGYRIFDRREVDDELVFVFMEKRRISQDSPEKDG